LSSSTGFTTGVPGLDRLLGALEPPYTLLVAGHPGAGKTTLATTICYSNAVRGRRCLYLTFYEDRAKYFRFMRRLGLDLESVESRGLFKFVRLPQTLDVEAVVGELNRMLAEGFEVVVVDSITTLLEPVAGNAERRAWLLNYFYQLPTAINGLLVLLAELPFGEERLGLGSVEFVADAIVVLKHRVEEGFLTRLVEVRKARGAPIHVAETYFTIAEGTGLQVFTPPVLEEPPAEEEEVPALGLPGGAAKFRRGLVVNAFYPPEPGAGLNTLLVVLAFAVRGGMRALVVSYIHSARVLREAVIRRLAEYGLPAEKVGRLLDRHVEFVALNPFAHSLTQLVARELTIIEQRKPDIVVFWGVHIPTYASRATELKELFNELAYLKSRGIAVVRAGPCLDESVCDTEVSISDVTYRIVREFGEDGSAQTRLYVYERFKKPRVFPGAVAEEALRESIEVLREYAERL
jgi:circadian clock protein KaiC